MKKTITMLCAAAALSACVPMQTIQPRADSSFVIDSQYDPIMAVKGDEEISGNYFGTPEYSWRLFSSLNKSTKEEKLAILFVNRYGGRGWRFWNTATTDTAEQLDVHVTARDVGGCGRYGCTHTEQIAAYLSRDQLFAAADRGIKVRFNSQDGSSWYVEYPPDVIKQHLNSFVAASARYR